MGPTRDRTAGIRRSIRLYHGDPERLRAMEAFYGMFVGPGTLAFDIGAHVGDRTRVFRSLGARVVAVEPQPMAMRALRLITGQDDGVVLVQQAVAERAGRVPMHLNPANPTVSTLSRAFIDAADGATGWDGQAWKHEIAVEATTLDHLIDRFGTPAFIKIDVEGHEEAVLCGLSYSVPAISFEVTTIHKQAALRSLDRLAALGDYHFSFSLGESFRLDGRWEDRETMARRIETLPMEANSGDVYAMLGNR